MAVRTPAAARTRTRSTTESKTAFLVLLLPAILLETAVFFLPMVYVFVQSFFDWQPGFDSAFIGVENYALLFTSADFWQVVGNQLFYLLGVPVFVFAPLVVGFALREKVPASGFFRSVYFLPAVMSPAIVGLVFRTLFATDGPLNAVIVGLGGAPVGWLTDPAIVKPVIVLLVLWAGFGTGVLIFSAAFSAVPSSQFEAARLDGVGFWGEFWHIAIPSVRSTISFWTMFQIVSLFLFMFGWVYVLTGGGPGLASATMDFSIYQTFMRFGFFGQAAAQSVVLILLIVASAALVGLVQLPRAIRGRRAAEGGVR